MSKIIHRNRRTLYEQIHSIDFAVSSLIESKGKYRKQFELMDEGLKSYFYTFQNLLGAISAGYESFLWNQSCENEKLAKKFLPDCLKEKLELVKQARKQF